MRETKQCQNCKSEFVIEPEDFKFYEKMQVPAPTFCPECRLIRRLAWRGDRAFYRRKEDFSGSEIFSMYSNAYKGKVFPHNVYWSDKWNPMDYGREYDFSRPFFEQFEALLKEVPIPAKTITEPVSEYSNNAAGLKNCYLVFNAGFSEDCGYGYRVAYLKDSYDMAHSENSELCYECFKCRRCYRAVFSSNCEECHDIFFSKNLVGCSNCFGCVNLRNKQYHIFNQPSSKEQYFEELKKLEAGSFNNVQKLRDRTLVLFLNYPAKFIQDRKNSTVSGDYIYNSKNVFSSFDIENGENLKYCHEIHYNPSAKDSYDYTCWGENASLLYECSSCGESVAGLTFCFNCYAQSRNLAYSIFCTNSSDLFGCIGLKNKNYSILNKQYTKEEYEKLRAKIIQHMNDMPYIDKKGRVYKYGEFFPIELSPFSYDESIAHEYFPLKKEEADVLGYGWKGPESRNYQITKKSGDLPDHINDAADSVLNEIIGCAHEQKCNENCTQAFRVIPKELEFLKKMNLPLPRLCPNCRHYQRIKQRSPLKLWHRKCQCAGEKSENKIYTNTADHIHHKKDERCPNEFETTYSPERPEIVYCEQCYLREVV